MERDMEMEQEKAKVRDYIVNTAARYGFNVKYYSTGWLPQIVADNMSFKIVEKAGKGWATGQVHVGIEVTASVSRMGGEPTPDELLRVADEIRRGAELLRELQNARLFYIANVGRKKGIICHHEYELKESYLIDTGRAKMYVYRCKKCGKEKRSQKPLF